MSVHTSLKDRKFFQGKGTTEKSHPGQRHASLRKQGLAEIGSLSKGLAVKTSKIEKPIRLRRFS